MKILQKLLGRDDIRFGDRTYMRRWLFPQRWLPRFFKALPGLRLHNIMASDEDRALHDHPFSFVTFVLRGGYYEHLADGTRTWHGPGSVLFRKADTLHRLELNVNITFAPHRYADDEAKEISAWTFVVRGPIRRAWGFQTDKGWVPWQDFGPAGHTS